MFAELRSSFRPAVVVLLALTLMTGIAYPLAMTGIAQLVLPDQANGSLIRKSDRVIGSELIGQAFASDRYFHGRPSAAGKDGYDASASAATNLAPGSKDLRNAIQGRMADLRAQGLTGPVPPDLVTTSASGLDPHISPEAALFQIPRVAASRKLDPAALRQLVEHQTEYPMLGFLGEPRVNVLELNRELDRVGAAQKQ
ncbi:MAG: potassium-transporting ATPase subunit KdpC [Proteobacteria bacterium]|nr:potassium-transporting ATPase subunit KdpC [Pseudomonadota bacterium]